jgi:hypothetical protein
VIGIVPKTEDISAMGRATFKLNDNFNAIAEYVYARNEITTLLLQMYSSIYHLKEIVNTIQVTALPLH